MSEKFQWTQTGFFYSFTPERAQCEGLSLKIPIIKISSTLKRDRDFSTGKGIAILNSILMKTVWDLPLNFGLTLLHVSIFFFLELIHRPREEIPCIPLSFFSFFACGFPVFTGWGVGKKSTQDALGVTEDQKKSENMTLMLTASL